MRDRWYADNRDLVKWAALVHLAAAHHAKKVVQVAFYRTDENAYTLTTSGGDVSFSNAVLRHFRRLEQIQGLARSTNLQIDVFKRPFELHDPGEKRAAFRKNYMQDLIAKVAGSTQRPLIVFLDPDTGVAPPHYDSRHVTSDEIRRVYEAVQPGDLLVLYQHARRTKDWLHATRQVFATALGVAEECINTITCRNLAADVAFFAAER